MGKIIKGGTTYGGSSTIAGNVSYDNTSSGLNSTTVQNAISELKTMIDDGEAAGEESLRMLGATTTALEDGATTNPITIDGESVTAVKNDVAIYNTREFYFSGTTWSEFGGAMDTTPTSGSANAVTSDGIKTALDTKQNVTQYATMPTITASMLGKVVQYVGTSDSNYKQGWNYVAVSDGAAEPTYSWQALMDRTPTSGSNNPVTSGAVYAVTPWTRQSSGSGAYMGASASASGATSVAAGYHTTSRGKSSLALGYYAETGSSAHYSASIGNNTLTTNANMLAIGKYNQSRENDLFNIGVGLDSNHRSNIVEVNSTSMNVNGDVKRDGVGIDDYTTTERKIGKWIDGSDLYQRTFEVTGLHNDGTYDDNILGTSDIVIRDWTGYLQYDTGAGKQHFAVQGYGSGAGDWIGCWTTTGCNDLSIRAKLNTGIYALDKAVITIKYTKISEQANASI